MTSTSLPPLPLFITLLQCVANLDISGMLFFTCVVLGSESKCWKGEFK
jgi:hypothetical protein